jgi:hypothetical protein
MYKDRNLQDVEKLEASVMGRHQFANLLEQAGAVKDQASLWRYSEGVARVPTESNPTGKVRLSGKIVPVSAAKTVANNNANIGSVRKFVSGCFRSIADWIDGTAKVRRQAYLENVKNQDKTEKLASLFSSPEEDPFLNACWNAIEKTKPENLCICKRQRHRP